VQRVEDRNIKEKKYKDSNVWAMQGGAKR